MDQNRIISKIIIVTAITVKEGVFVERAITVINRTSLPLFSGVCTKVYAISPIENTNQSKQFVR
jgi:hypothetical protein